MEKHLLYKEDVGGLIPLCPNIHMEWRRSIFANEGSFDHHEWALVTFFDPRQKYEMVMVNEYHHIYASIMMPSKVCNHKSLSLIWNGDGRYLSI